MVKVESTEAHLENGARPYPTYIDDPEDEPNGKKRKLQLKYISNKSRRQVTFSKRRIGLMKKCYELSVMTGVNMLLLVASTDSKLVYTFSTPKLRRFIEENEGKSLVRNCLKKEDS
ncbi:hypothetical protein Kpol_1073p27 [Vanderwaltozyma polyspora DSM 70294]|uniref:MADS-box domain-containing protein n=1 Tax=Vanderwaltozyma polyspora (strain ATCC 22028 / DSM 70294 / BCRC 21397 / CBS 2163 / NBRC 10782 / NRRL Y-8283 / UCD 57-17) TaxID=436907 RepID=A7TPT8_VANPO|nr:uncharacterized protein Kpol_1073p27 [Vanderwaltozyma polyspora DSM 70294]EDO15739.1 hypothetical protein Kpol_1073p27 [Vanderwaltozyma polyspora DSM 70294]